MRGHSLLLGFGVMMLAASSQPAESQSRPVGVLLGLQGPTGLRTLWIQGTGPALVFAREIRGLVVPYESNLCQLLLTTADTDPGYMNGDEVYTHSALSLDCGRGTPKGRPEADEGCVGSSSIHLLFVSSSHISLSVDRDSACFGRTSGYDNLIVLPAKEVVGRWLFDPRWGLPLQSVGSAAQRALKKAAAPACKAQDWERQDQLLGYLALDDCSQVVPTEWGVRRGLGRWTLVGRTATERANYIDYEVPDPLPNFIRHWGKGALSAAVALEQAKDLQDFFTSPGGEFAVVLRPEAIQAARLQEGRLVLGEVLGGKHAEEAIVSIEWATGPHVKRWTDLVDKLATRPSRQKTPRR